MSLFEEGMFNFDDMQSPDCEHDDCQPLMETAEIIMRHLKEHFYDEEHRDMTPPCVICVTFHIAHMMGVTIGLRHPDQIPKDIRRKILSEEFPDPFAD